MKATPERDLQAEQDYAEFTGWWAAQGYDADHAQTFYGADIMAETFLAGMQAARDLGCGINDGRPVLWDGTIPPGGYVCAVPDGNGGICGYPVESEPCGLHDAQPQPAPELDTP